VVVDIGAVAERVPVAAPAGTRGSMQRRIGRDQQVAALFDAHYTGLWRLATLLLGDAAAAEEAVQEAFVRTYAGWWRLRQPEAARWYLRAAVVNECRSRGRRRVTEDRSNRLAWAADRSLAAREGEETGEQLGEMLAVLEAVRALPERQREAVVLRYYEDLPEAAVARAMGCSVGTVKSQLSKARATLAQLLAGPQELAGRQEPRPGAGDG
jgi:RNA polymerase sigma-70 factor (sigma-E family)